MLTKWLYCIVYITKWLYCIHYREKRLQPISNLYIRIFNRLKCLLFNRSHHTFFITNLLWFFCSHVSLLNFYLSVSIFFYKHWKEKGKKKKNQIIERKKKLWRMHRERPNIWGHIIRDKFVAGVFAGYIIFHLLISVSGR
jgi:hypothetical protein